jgi:hypothetical protein
MHTPSAKVHRLLMAGFRITLQYRRMDLQYISHSGLNSRYGILTKKRITPRGIKCRQIFDFRNTNE